MKAGITGMHGGQASLQRCVCYVMVGTWYVKLRYTHDIGRASQQTIIIPLLHVKEERKTTYYTMSTADQYFPHVPAQIIGHDDRATKPQGRKPEEDQD